MPDAPEPPRDSAIPSTREDLIRAAAALREEAARILEEAKENASARVAVAAAYERLAGVRERIDLNTGHESATTEPLMHVESAGAGRSQGQISDEHKGHKFVSMLDRRSLAVRDVGDELERRLKRRFPNQTIQSWYRDESDIYYRPIPEDVAIVLKGEPYHVPLSAWSRIRRPKAK